MYSIHPTGGSYWEKLHVPRDLGCEPAHSRKQSGRTITRILLAHEVRKKKYDNIFVINSL